MIVLRRTHFNAFIVSFRGNIRLNSLVIQGSMKPHLFDYKLLYFKGLYGLRLSVTISQFFCISISWICLSVSERTIPVGCLIYIDMRTHAVPSSLLFFYSRLVLISSSAFWLSNINNTKTICIHLYLKFEGPSP